MSCPKCSEAGLTALVGQWLVEMVQSIGHVRNRTVEPRAEMPDGVHVSICGKPSAAARWIVWLSKGGRRSSSVSIARRGGLIAVVNLGPGTTNPTCSRRRDASRKLIETRTNSFACFVAIVNARMSTPLSFFWWGIGLLQRLVCPLAPKSRDPATASRGGTSLRLSDTGS